MLYLWLPIEMFVYINSQVLYVIFLFNTSDKAKQQRCTCITLFCTFLCRQYTTTTWKCLISRFVIETEKMWIHFSCDVFMAVSCRGILNSLIFTKTWSMQAWIPVISSSLCFRKSAFRFRVDSILKWRVYIKLKDSWLRPFFFGAWAKQAVIKPIAVTYELAKITQEMLFADWAQ